jgi:hypothetical protein
VGAISPTRWRKSTTYVLTIFYLYLTRAEAWTHDRMYAATTVLNSNIFMYYTIQFPNQFHADHRTINHRLTLLVENLGRFQVFTESLTACLSVF